MQPDATPRPESAHTVEEFTAQLRLVKIWAGNPSLRQLEKLSGFPRSTMADALSPKRTTLPSLEVLHGLLRACRVPPPGVARWTEAWRRVQAGHEPQARSAMMPRQLPANVPGFVGRAKALTELSTLLEPSAARLAVVSGIAGSGKTALVVHWAHQVAGRFPDGQVYVDLRGYSSAPALTSEQALALTLRAFGVSGEDIPVERDALVGMYRSITSDKRALVVLDNAPSVAHVRPLLPGGSACLTVVTSRDRLTGLVALEGAHRLELDVLTPEEAPAVLIGVLGAERVLREEEAVAELIRLCGHLPLALRITAANLSDHPQRTIVDQVLELKAAGLTALAVDGDSDAAVRAAFDHSYAGLDTAARTLFRWVGVAPGPQLTLPAMTALLGQDAEGALRTLVAAHLFESPVPDRYSVHDLLRLYAADRAGVEDSAADVAAAHDRLYGWYLRHVVAAARLIRPDFLMLPSGMVPSGMVPSPDTDVVFADSAEALRWIDAERANLVAAIEGAASRGHARMAWLLTDALRGYYWLRRHTVEWLAVARVGLAAAEQEQDSQARAAMHLSLGTARWGAGDHHLAADHFRRAVELSRAAGDGIREFSTLGNLGGVYSELGSLREAVDCFAGELAFYQEIGDKPRQARAQGNLGLTQLRLGRLADAAVSLQAAVDLREAIGESRAAANSLGALGVVYRYLGELDRAAELLTRSRDLNREHEDRASEAVSLDDLARVHRAAGRSAEALECASEALAMARETGAHRAEVDALITVAAVRRSRDDLLLAWRKAVSIGYGLGKADALVELATEELAAGDLAAAAAHATEAVDLARATGQRIHEGLALRALAAVQEANGEPSEESRGRAAEILGEVGVRDRPKGL